MKRLLIFALTASSVFAQVDPFEPNPVLLLKYGTMTTDLDANFHKILNLDTSNLPVGTGTVTSVGLSTNVPFLQIAGTNPVTTAGTIQVNGNFTGGGTLYLNDAGNFTSPPGTGPTTSGTSILSGDGLGGFANVTVGANLSYNSGTHTLSGTASAQTHSITFVSDGSGSVLTTGTKNPIKVNYGGTLQGWSIMCSPSGSITADVFRAADNAGLPVTSIIGGGGTKPSITTNVENKSTSFTGWTSTTITANDNLAFSLSGITNATYCELTLYYQ